MFSCFSCCRITFNEFIQAAQEGDVKTVNAYIKQNKTNTIAINEVDQEGRTALIWAAYFGRLSVVDALLKVPGIDIHIKDNYGRNTALWWAQNKDYHEIAEILSAVKAKSLAEEKASPLRPSCSSSALPLFRALG